MTKKIVPGYRQGRLTVLHQSMPEGASPRVRWWCRCECGHQWSVSESSLLSGAEQCRKCSFAATGDAHRRQWSDEEAALLGTVSDREVARRLGLHPSTARAERARRGIGPCLRRG